MLISARSLLSWGQQTATAIMAVGSGRWHRAGREYARVDQPRSRRAGPPAGPAAPNGAASGTPSPGQLPPQQHPAPPRRPASVPITPAVVRAWAHAQGLPVADRGRIPGWALDQYLAQEGRPAPTQRTTARPAPPPASLDLLGRLTLT